MEAAETDVEKVIDSIVGAKPDEQIPSIGTANEIAREILDAGQPTVNRRCEDCGELFEASGKSRYCDACKAARRLAGMRDRKIACEGCGKVFHPTNGAVKLCDECRANKDIVRAWKDKQNVRCVQVGKESGAEVTTEREHFPALAEERRKKRQPVTVNLDNFIPKRVDHMTTGVNTAPIGESVPQNSEEKSRPDLQKELLRTARALARLAKASGDPVEKYLDIIMHFAAGFAALDDMNVGDNSD